ncbi:MAG: DPP IV N-terminal domain-containing protein [Candidatus Poribacteria bacterium]|nr:DPP IV N-terminal domain-containing protein [Candidatus Poribacteria bacterium]
MNHVSPPLRRSLFLLIFALTVASDSAAQGLDSRIVFASNRDGDWDIYSMDVNGENLLQLTNHRTSDEYPAWSPDGKRIAFNSNRGLSPDLYVMDSDGNNAIRLTRDGRSKSRPSWSPDGARIAYSSFRLEVGNSEIYVMDADGNNETNLTNHRWNDNKPSWSPDGNKMAFESSRTGLFNDPRHIFVMNADGTERRNLTDDTHLRFNSAPSWSPDGRKIAFSSRFNIAGDDLFVITADGKELEQLTDGPGTSRLPVYSPDGRKIAFVSGRREDSNIYLMDANGTNAVKLTKRAPGTGNTSPSWLPGALAVNPKGKLPISWGMVKWTGNPR